MLPFLWRHIRAVFTDDFLFILNYVATLSDYKVSDMIMHRTYQIGGFCGTQNSMSASQGPLTQSPVGLAAFVVAQLG